MGRIKSLGFIFQGMSAIARIETALNYNNNFKWNFVDYPGIGFHKTFREKLNEV